MLLGGIFIATPAAGPVVVLGYLAAIVITALENAILVGGLSAIGAALYSIGIPKNSVVEYEAALKADNFLVMAHGTAEEVARAKVNLASAKPSRLDVHAAAKAVQPLDILAPAGVSNAFALVEACSYPHSRAHLHQVATFCPRTEVVVQQVLTLKGGASCRSKLSISSPWRSSSSFVLIGASVKILREYERAVVFTLGRFQKVKGPGLVLLIPFIQQMVRVDLRIQVIEIPTQDVISRDNVSMKVDAVLYFNVVGS